MSIPTFDEDLNIISALSDEPNDYDGMSSSVLKGKFDSAGNKLKSYINDVLIAEVEVELATALSSAQTIANASAASATASAGSASDASGSASAASTSATAAATSATNAQTSATNAAASASAANTSASNAAASATAAGTSASNASGSASAAASSASASASSASAADTSKTDAAASAQAAATSASDAASSAQAAADSAASLVVVNDLTTGGTTNALSAEQGKVLNASISELSTKVLEKTSYGVYTGLGVTAQSTPNMTVNVATGTIYMGTGARFTPAANTALAINTADDTNPRIDIVYVNSTGVISYLAGTAAASPAAPSVPTGGQKLAEITVAAGATTITSAAIADRRKNLWTEARIIPTLVNGWANRGGNYSPVAFYKDSFGIVHLEGTITGGATNTVCFSLPTGYCPPAAFRVSLYSEGATSVYAMISAAAANGVITIRYASGTPTIVSLDGITFRAA